MSDLDYDRVTRYLWWLDNRGYVVSRLGGASGYSPILLHRFILGLKSSDKTQVDHINGNRLDNRRENLRLATNAQNVQNRPKIAGTYSSKYKGVNWHKGKWVARIGVDYKRINLGSFTNEEEAARAYDKAAKERFGEFANLNFLGESLGGKEDK